MLTFSEPEVSLMSWRNHFFFQFFKWINAIIAYLYFQIFGILLSQSSESKQTNRTLSSFYKLNGIFQLVCIVQLLKKLNSIHTLLTSFSNQTESCYIFCSEYATLYTVFSWMIKSKRILFTAKYFLASRYLYNALDTLVFSYVCFSISKIQKKIFYWRIEFHCIEKSCYS